MRQHGIENAAQLARRARLSPTNVGAVLNFKIEPMTKDGTWRHSVLKIADVFGCLPEEMFSAEQLTLSVESNTRDYLLTHKEVMQLASARVDPGRIEKEIECEQIAAVVRTALDEGVSPYERRVLELRFGLNGTEEVSLQQAAELLGLSRERIRQIEARALRKLRNPKSKNWHELRQCLDAPYEGPFDKRETCDDETKEPVFVCGPPRAPVPLPLVQREEEEEEEETEEVDDDRKVHVSPGMAGMLVRIKQSGLYARYLYHEYLPSGARRAKFEQSDGTTIHASAWDYELIRREERK